VHLCDQRGTTLCQKSHSGKPICHRLRCSRDATTSYPISCIISGNYIVVWCRERNMRVRQDGRLERVKDERPQHSPQDKSRRTLSVNELKRLTRFLDANDKPFSITLRAALPYTTGPRGLEKLQGDLYDPTLTVLYTIKPIQRWKSLRKYKKFTSMCLVLLGTHGVI
jgi:hypothetical protein